MEGEGDSRVHFSDAGDAWSSSRHVAVLQSLDAVEKVRPRRSSSRHRRRHRSHSSHVS